MGKDREKNRPIDRECVCMFHSQDFPHKITNSFNLPYHLIHKHTVTLSRSSPLFIPGRFRWVGSSKALTYTRTLTDGGDLCSCCFTPTTSSMCQLLHLTVTLNDLFLPKSSHARIVSLSVLLFLSPYNLEKLRLVYFLYLSFYLGMD